MERALIAEYEALIRELATALSPDNHALAMEIASLPEQIRGFGHIKMRNAEEAKAREADLLALWRGGDAPASAAERSQLVMRIPGFDPEMTRAPIRNFETLNAHSARDSGSSAGVRRSIVCVILARRVAISCVTSAACWQGRVKMDRATHAAAAREFLDFL